MSDDHRRAARQRWGAAARGWAARADELRAASMPVSIAMVEAINPQPGQTLLELAAGPGDTGFLAAELIEPGGTLICSDLAPEMLTVAQERAAAQGLTNVRFRQIDVETAIDQPAASVDGVLCRWGFMLLADPDTALRETRRVLKRGGRVAFAAWGPPEDNPWSRLPARVAAEQGLAPLPDPGAPGQFAWAREGICQAVLENSGFEDIEVEDVWFSYRHPSVEAWWASMLEMSQSIHDLLGGLDAGRREAFVADVLAAAEPYASPDGGIEFPARTWVAVGAA
jgi:SAM-dependent methyltransferase